MSWEFSENSSRDLKLTRPKARTASRRCAACLTAWCPTAEDAKRFNYGLVHGSKTTYGSLIVGWKEGADPTVVVVPTVPDLSGCGDPEICPRSAVKKAYQNKYPTDAFIIYPDGRHYLAINTFEWLEDEKLFIYVDQGPEEQAFETFFKTCYATK